MTSGTDQMLWLHGGGWRDGDPYDAGQRAFAAALAAHDLDVVPGTYRFTDVAVWPAQLDDVRATARRLLAERPGARLFAGGESAGAHLALQLALRGASGPRDIAGVVALYPPVDPLAVDWPDTRSAQSRWEQLLGHPLAPDDDATIDSTIVGHVGNGVPVLLLHGIGDEVVPVSQTVTLTSALLGAGHPVTTYLTDGGHATLDLARPDLHAVVGQFLSRCRGVSPS